MTETITKMTRVDMTDATAGITMFMFKSGAPTGSVVVELLLVVIVV